MNFFITGGSGNLGASIVKEALANGHNVAFTYWHNEEKAKTLLQHATEFFPDIKCRAYQMNTRHSAEVQRVSEQLLADFGSVQVIVASAGITSANLLVSTSDEEWRDLMETNLTGVFYTCRSLLPDMLRQRFGRIIIVSSVARGGGTGHAGYCASKAALSGLAGSLAKEYGSRGITTNVVSPGVLDTSSTQEEAAGHNPAFRAFWQQYCPLRRLGEVQDVSPLVMWLSSKQASFINGAMIAIDGGLNWAP